MTIGGTLTNSSTNGNGSRHRQHRHHVGRHCDGERGGRADQRRRSVINIEGSASVQATLNVANAAAGFGSGRGWRPGRSSSKTTRSWNSRPARSRRSMANLTLDGASADVADAGATTSNSALTGLTSVTDIFRLENGAKVTTTGNLSITGNAIVSLDGPDLIFGGGGSQPDDRREADQQQHQRQWRQHRQHRPHFGRHFDGERDGRAVQWHHERDQHRGQRVRPGDPECRQCGGRVRHEGGGDRDGLPRKRRALGIQDRLDHDDQWRT